METKIKEAIYGAMTLEFESLNSINKRAGVFPFYQVKSEIEQLVFEGRVETLQIGKRTKYRKTTSPEPVITIQAQENHQIQETMCNDTAQLNQTGG
jgi:hypothetical protein